MNYRINFLVYLRPFRHWPPPTLFTPHSFPCFPSPLLPAAYPSPRQLHSVAILGTFPARHSFCLVCTSHLLILNSTCHPLCEAFPDCLRAELGLLWAPVPLCIDLPSVIIFGLFHSVLQFHLNRL